MTIPESKRSRIIGWFASALADITTANGFATNAGQAVYIGFTPQLGETDPTTVIVLTIGSDSPSWQADKVMLRLPLTINVTAKATENLPWAEIESVLADVKRAIEIEDRSLGRLVPRGIERGAVRPFERESGSLLIGASVEYIAPYTEGWGHPEG